MATSSSRDVRLDVEIETLGADRIKSLAADFRTLAKDGGDAAPKFAAAADQLDRIAQQAGAVDALKRVTAEVESLGAAEQVAAEKAARLEAELKQQAAAAAAAAKAQAEMQAAVDKAARELDAARGAIKELRAETSATSKGTQQYANDLAELVRAQNAAQAALREQQVALRNAKAETTAASAAERQAQQAYDASAEAARRGATALRERESAQRQAQAATVALGVATSDLAATEDRLLASTQAVLAAGRQQQELTAAQRVADELAAAEANALANARRAGAAAAESELAAIRDSEDFTRRYAAAQQKAKDDALNFVLALEREEAAARAAAAELDRLGAAARKSNADAQYVREVAAALDAVDAEARRAAEAVERLRGFYQRLGAERATVDAAFGQTGVRSIEAINFEIGRVNSSLSLLRDQFEAGAVSAADLARATSSAEVRLATLKREIATIPSLPSAFEKINSGIQNVITRFAALGATLATLGFAFRPIIEAEVALQQITRTLTQVTGSTDKAAASIEFLRNVAQRSGQSFGDLGESYAKFAASALQVGISAKDTQAVFESVALATGNLGLSSDQAKRALEALSQIASKGTVSMEELRQQLGDALPGVLPALAKELGLADAELNKVVQSGQLLAFEAIPAVGRAIKNLGPEGGKEVEGLRAGWERFKNVILETTTVIAEGGVGKALGATLEVISKFTETAAAKFAYLASAQVGLIEGVAAAAGRLATGQPSQALRAFGEAFEAATTKAEALKGRVDGVSQSATALAPATAAAADAIRATAVAAGVGAVAADGLAKSFAAMALANQKAIDAADRQADNLGKIAEARKSELEYVRQYGVVGATEAENRRAVADAASRAAVAIEEARAAREREVDALEHAKAAAVAEATARGVGLDKIKALVEGYDKLAEKERANLERMVAQAAQARETALAAEVLSLSVKDNSDRFDELQVAAKAAEARLAAVQVQFARGRVSANDLQKAVDDLRKAKALLTDAIGDQDKALKRLIDSEKASLDLANNLIKVEIAQAKVELDRAVRIGDSTRARQLEIRIRELELDVTKNSTDAKRAEANETIRSLTLQKQELEATGALTPELRNELEVRITRAKAQAAEADAAAILNKAQEELIVRVKGGIDTFKEHTGATNDNTAAQTTNSEAVGGNTERVRGNVEQRIASRNVLEQEAKALENYNRLLREDPSRLGGGISGIRNSSAGTNPFAGFQGPDRSTRTSEGSNIGTGNGDYVFVNDQSRSYIDPKTQAVVFGYWKPSAALEAKLEAARLATIARNQVSPGAIDTAFNTVGRGGTNGVSPVQNIGSSYGTSDTEKLRPDGVYEINFNLGGQRYSVYSKDQSQVEGLVRALEDAFKMAGGV